MIDEIFILVYFELMLARFILRLFNDPNLWDGWYVVRPYG